MKYSHTSSRKLLARLEAKIKLQGGIDEPIDRYDVWKALRWRKKGEYVNEEARYMGEEL